MWPSSLRTPQISIVVHRSTIIFVCDISSIFNIESQVSDKSPFNCFFRNVREFDTSIEYSIWPPDLTSHCGSAAPSARPRDQAALVIFEGFMNH